MAAVRGRSLGRDFGWLWGAYAISILGTWLAFDALPLIAILVLHVGPAAVSLLAASGLAVGAVVAIPLAPWIEFRHKRPVMVAMDLVRFLALVSIPVAYALGRLTFAQLVVVAVVVGAADIAFKAASGAFLKWLVPRRDLLDANGRFESTMWTATAIGPPVGGALIGIVGPVATVIANAVSFLLSAGGLRRVRATEPAPARSEATGMRMADVVEGWRYIFGHPTLRRLFLNTVSVNALIMAPAPLLAVLMLRGLGFAPWQYGLAFGAPCIGGLIGSRLSRPLAQRFGDRRTLLVSGALRSSWSIGLAFIWSGPVGLAFVMAVQFCLVTCVGIFNPLFATHRLEQTAPDRVARVLSAWSVTSNGLIAVTTAAWGLLAAATSPRAAIAAAGVLLVATASLLPWRIGSAREDPRVDDRHGAGQPFVPVPEAGAAAPAGAVSAR